MDVPVQYFQSVIAIQLAVSGALLFQIRYFDTREGSAPTSETDPRVRLLLAVVLLSSLFGSLEAIREHGGRWAAILVTVGLAVSLLPILLRVLPPLRLDAQTKQRDPHFWVTMLGLILYVLIIAVFVSID
jgi:hypothetical protein